MKNTLKIGIASVEEQRKRTLAIALGERKREEDEPTIWFPSRAALLSVFSDENCALLEVIRSNRPKTITLLAETVRKEPSNVSRSLHLLERFGVVRLVKKGREVQPEVVFEHVNVALV
ncbi:HVO_A0114 family putative DNA-binding protein [Noviherbaspirillum soli]|uniref:HVO_A0114 family putative DNA-binding protein n=1 Tax=Noviherbaspirillum soli TaxID=1064518 RepID=UPI00188B3FC8|nr:transcriptional regulator [Noviherbaspirillum soli]